MTSEETSVEYLENSPTKSPLTSEEIPPTTEIPQNPGTPGNSDEDEDWESKNPEDLRKNTRTQIKHQWKI